MLAMSSDNSISHIPDDGTVNPSACLLGSCEKLRTRSANAGGRRTWCPDKRQV